MQNEIPRGLKPPRNDCIISVYNIPRKEPAMSAFDELTQRLTTASEKLRHLLESL
jgi:hypothetical protein